MNNNDFFGHITSSNLLQLQQQKHQIFTLSSQNFRLQEEVTAEQKLMKEKLWVSELPLNH